jgi:methyl-accepting chemotaxis protein
MRKVGLAIGQVPSIATAITAAIQHRSAATREISSGVRSVTVATTTSAQAMQEVSGIAEQMDVAVGPEVGQTATYLACRVNNSPGRDERANNDNRRP